MPPNAQPPRSIYDIPLPDPPGSFLASRPHLPYLLPFFCFILFFLPSMFGNLAGLHWEQLWITYHPLIYFTKTIVAALLLYLLWTHYTKIRWTHLPLGLLLGLLGTPLWIGATYLTHSLGLTNPTPIITYNPDLMLPLDHQRWLFFFIRIAGPTLVVPLMEELLFRDFLQRTLLNSADFQSVPIGTYSLRSLLLMSAFFAVNHGASMLLPGFLYGLLMGLLVIRTKSLGACILAHAATNLTLYLYCIHTGDWQFM